MSAPLLPSGLAEIADRYDAVLCDVWGVIHNGREAFPEACDALVRFQETRGPVVLISNAPRPSKFVLPQLRGLKVPDAAWSGFVSSGDATRAELIARAPGPAWDLGPERDMVLYQGLDLALAGPEEAAFISCTGFIHEEVETPEDYRERLTAAAARGLTMICANPDLVVQKGDSLIYCAGALAKLYTELGGTVVMAGKPYAPIYDCAYQEVDRLAGKAVDRKRILAIGDGIATDVAGANAQGLDLLFIAAGIHGADAIGPGGKLDEAAIADLLEEKGARATYAAPKLAW